jgi:serine/threonine protein kinase
MEYCACSVEDILFYCPEEPLIETHIAAVCAAIVKSLAYLHAYSISHRDIKSANILLKESGEVKIGRQYYYGITNLI